MFTVTDNYVERGQIYHYSETPRIPYFTHRVWLTDPWDPSEMGDVITEQAYYDRMTSTNKVLEESTPENKWTHYLWTIDKSLIPKTVRYFETEGYEVRDMRDLKFWS